MLAHNEYMECINKAIKERRLGVCLDKIYANIIFRNAYWPAKPCLLFAIKHYNRTKRYVNSFVGIIRYGSLSSLLALRY